MYEYKSTYATYHYFEFIFEKNILCRTGYKRQKPSFILFCLFIAVLLFSATFFFTFRNHRLVWRLFLNKLLVTQSAIQTYFIFFMKMVIDSLRFENYKNILDNLPGICLH